MSVRTRSISQTLSGLFLMTLVLSPLTLNAQEIEDHGEEPPHTTENHEHDQAHEDIPAERDHATGVLVLLTLGLALRARKANTPQRIKAYRAALITSAILVSVTGHFGAALIFGLDHFFN